MAGSALPSLRFCFGKCESSFLVLFSFPLWTERDYFDRVSDVRSVRSVRLRLVGPRQISLAVAILCGLLCLGSYTRLRAWRVGERDCVNVDTFFLFCASTLVRMRVQPKDQKKETLG